MECNHKRLELCERCEKENLCLICLKAENKKLKKKLGLARGDLTVDKDTGKVVRAWKKQT